VSEKEGRLYEVQVKENYWQRRDGKVSETVLSDYGKG
jgi:hypothetical protein